MFAAFLLAALLPSISLARIVTIAPWDTSINYNGAVWNVPSPVAGATVQQCPGNASAAIASVPGAQFSFKFTGTSVSIATTAGTGTAAFNVTRDGQVVTPVDPSVLATQPCYVSFQSQSLDKVEHTINVTVTEPGQMALLSIAYDTGDDGTTSDTGKPMSATVTVVIAVCCVFAFVAILAAVFFLCCRRNRRPPTDVEKMSMRFKNNNRGILTETPTFVQYQPADKKHSVDSGYYEETKLTSGRGSPKPSTIQPYRAASPLQPPMPVYGVPPQNRNMLTTQTRTIGATETAFSV